VRFSSWNRREDESGSSIKRPFWDWQGATRQVPEVVFVMPLFNNRFFSHCGLPIATDRAAHSPPEPMPRVMTKAMMNMKTLFFIMDAYSRSVDIARFSLKPLSFYQPILWDHDLFLRNPERLKAS